MALTKISRCLLFVFGLILLGLAFTSPLSAHAARSLQHLWQLGHVFLFAVWVLVLYPGHKRESHHAHSYFFIIILATLIIGFGIEYGQSFVGREFSLRDIGFDLSGSLIAICGLIASGAMVIHRYLSRLVTLLTLLLAVYAFSPLALAVFDELNMQRNFPMLADFNSVLEKGRWKGDGEIVSLLSARGEEKVLRIKFNTDRYSSIALSYFPSDWRQYNKLRFELFNPERLALALTIRIHDGKHYKSGKGEYLDRFNQKLHVAPGWNTFLINLADVAAAPSKRELDLGDIQALGLFSIDLPKPRLIYLDKMKLLP